MKARFAESCRQAALELVGFEVDVEQSSLRDEISGRNRLLDCEKDIFIGVFFDGTNNNKYRDTPEFSQSNVARLYEIYPGTPAAQKEPTLRPKVSADGTKVDRPRFGDLPFKSDSVQAADFPYYRKIYILGLGTPMPDVGDSGSSVLRTEDARHKAAVEKLTARNREVIRENRLTGAQLTELTNATQRQIETEKPLSSGTAGCHSPRGEPVLKRAPVALPFVGFCGTLAVLDAHNHSGPCTPCTTT